MRTQVLAVAIAVATTLPARAIDRWEAAADDTADTYNVLRHGMLQQGHDLESTGGIPDQDFMRVVSKPRHSYQASVRGLRWGCGAACPALYVQTASGTPIGLGSPGGDDIVLPDGSQLGTRVGWISGAGTTVMVRVAGVPAMTAEASGYDIELLDTTLFVPRWNNTASQTTVLVLQNTMNYQMFGTVSFHDAAGVLLATADVSVPQHGVHVLQTASIAALQGKSGSATIAQAPYAALVGKAVALEPATGFTFDTAIVSLPY
jgi:hypothetical protein